ncbi:MAG: TIGR01777 family oxidoreductase [Verrucomicrobiales bacterium]
MAEPGAASVIRSMHIGITGATGFVGSAICRAAAEAGHTPVGFSRRADASRGDAAEMRQLGKAGSLAGLGAIIHLAGEPIFGLWTPSKKRAILESREQGTRDLVDQIAALPDSERPKTLVCTSGVGFYGDAGDAALDESAPRGGGFLAMVCERWEGEALRAADIGLRVVRVRLGVVLGKGGGAGAIMRLAFKSGLGGKLGSGDQWMSWIDLRDAARLFTFCATDPAIAGAVNGVAPEPIRNRDFTKIAAKVARRPAIFAAPSFALKALGGLHEMMLFSQRCTPEAASGAGFEFQHTDLRAVLEHCWR